MVAQVLHGTAVQPQWDKTKTRLRNMATAGGHEEGNRLFSTLKTSKLAVESLCYKRL
jgi:hypothetical protein